MSAIEQAREMYEAAGKDFDQVITEHLYDGIVLASPLWFLMLRAIQIENGGLAWFVECAIGDMRQLANLVAIKLPYVAYCRTKNGKKRFTVHPSERLLRHTKGEVKL